jgi:type IV pilus assembly protein PilA
MKALLKKVNRKGFTLAELLIVVAIIGVLVAISIPIFTAQLEKSREATDVANIRSAYAEIMTDILDSADKGHSKSVKMIQTQNNWQNTVNEESLKRLAVSGTTASGGTDVTITGSPTSGGTTSLVYANSAAGGGTLTITVG